MDRLCDGKGLGVADEVAAQPERLEPPRRLPQRRREHAHGLVRVARVGVGPAELHAVEHEPLEVRARRAEQIPDDAQRLGIEAARRSLGDGIVREVERAECLPRAAGDGAEESDGGGLAQPVGGHVEVAQRRARPHERVGDGGGAERVKLVVAQIEPRQVRARLQQPCEQRRVGVFDLLRAQVERR
eukprot:5600551-Pleurochrysis_carterae.AAC.4